MPPDVPQSSIYRSLVGGEICTLGAEKIVEKRGPGLIEQEGYCGLHRSQTSKGAEELPESIVLVGRQLLLSVGLQFA